MLLLGGGLVGLVAGLLAGGRLGRLVEIRFKWPVVVLAALLIKELGVISPLARTPLAPALYTLALAVLAVWTALHRQRLPGVELVAVGMLMNLVVVVANLGHMPVSVELARFGPPEIFKTGVLGQYMLMGRGSRLDFLGDYISLPGTLGRILPQPYSPGDIVACLGMALTLFLAVRPVELRGAITTR
ncbi:MAG TPA: DUF5317 family protein [Candidatus Dormibacteraeota bacterium]